MRDCVHEHHVGSGMHAIYLIPVVLRLSPHSETTTDLCDSALRQLLIVNVPTHISKLAAAEHESKA